jgi:hypothetical protein
MEWLIEELSKQFKKSEELEKKIKKKSGRTQV